MKALVIDDTKICLERAKEVLEKEGWEVDVIHVTSENRDSFLLSSLDAGIPFEEKLKGVTLVVSDLELGGGITTWAYICALKKLHSEIPVVLLTGRGIDYELRDEMKKVGIHYVDKGRKFNSDIYSKAGKRVLKDTATSWMGHYVGLPLNNGIISPDDPAWFKDSGMNFIDKDDPRLETPLPPLWSQLSSGNTESLDELFEKNKEWKANANHQERAQGQLAELQAIIRLADEALTEVEFGEKSEFSRRRRTFSILEEGSLTHQIGHALCDGILTGEQIEPYLGDLKKVLDRIKDYVKTDERFRPCAEFIIHGRPVEELPAIQGMY